MPMTSEDVTNILAIIILVALLVAGIGIVCGKHSDEGPHHPPPVVKPQEPVWKEIGYYRLTDPDELSRMEQEILCRTAITDYFPPLYEAFNTRGQPFWHYEVDGQVIYPPRYMVERRAVIPRFIDE